MIKTDGKDIGYIKMVKSEKVHSIFPQAPHMGAGLELFALFDGTGFPTVLCDTREAAAANAWQNNMKLQTLQ